MAYETGLKPFVFDQEGLFARKSSSNILSDPRILEHLRIVAEEAQIEEADEDKISDQDEYEFERKDLSTKIAAYNKRNQFGAFRVVQNVSVFIFIVINIPFKSCSNYCIYIYLEYIKKLKKFIRRDVLQQLKAA